MSLDYQAHLFAVGVLTHNVESAIRVSQNWNVWCFEPGRIDYFLEVVGQGVDSITEAIIPAGVPDPMLNLVFEDAGEYLLEMAELSGNQTIQAWCHDVKGILFDIKFLHENDLSGMLRKMDVWRISDFLEEASNALNIIQSGLLELISTGAYIPIDESFDPSD